MKTLKILKCLIVVLLVSTYSCSSSDNDGDGDGGQTSVTEITLTADKTSLFVGETVTFTVTTNTGQDVTNSAQITADGLTLSSSNMTLNAPSTISARASYQGLESNEVAVTAVNNNLASVAITANSQSLKVGDIATFTVTATYDNGDTADITNAADININNAENADNKYLALNDTDLVVNAAFNGVMSQDLLVDVQAYDVPASYTKKAVIEDYTGDWCGWCPRVSYAIEQVGMVSDNVFTVAAHIDDQFQNTYSTSLRNMFGVSGYPTAYLNRDAVWTAPEPNNVNQATNYAQGNQTSGLSVSSILRGNNGDVKIHVAAGFGANVSGAKLVVFVLEDGLTSNQRNYTGYYGGVDPISGFTHDHVLRYSFTNVGGDAIPAGDAVAGGSYDFVFEGQLPGTIANYDNTGIMVMIVGADNKVINAQYAHIGDDKDFD